ncbi:MAG TPA: right-handed parallel beta-helix repeat-containing protein [Spirochaetota bacterium]|jgi:hypothetical protein|nr:right-handed parallel beta-helix repeat-containing protein [Spirochaetota bacterium]HPM34235.1 right-handed parallel beta-helix repeat-containing protein [Spirochaetota bacterium]HPY03465.1 right-handed parallel beta-helix repeat-containing protein [Spirochaetota bacterium]HQA52835.1 right-handed parallel beta-helix repeat-containing protein [Spirochaetota bacterium]
MKKIRIILSVSTIFIAVTAGYRAMGGAPAAQNIIHVTSVKELFENIGSNRTIVCAPGLYDVRNAQGVVTEFLFFKYSEPQIQHVKGLVIRGVKGVEIINGRNDGFVLIFNDCRDVTLEGLTLGHEKDTEHCHGGVVWFENTTGIKITKCDIYGCGLTGIEFDRVKGVSVADSIIRDCTICALSLEECIDVRFDRCTFSGTEGRTLFYIRRVRDVVIADSAVKNNRSTHLIFGANLMTDRVSVIRSRFENNAALRLSDSNSRIRFTESVFTGNSFDKK